MEMSKNKIIMLIIIAVIIVVIVLLFLFTNKKQEIVEFKPLIAGNIKDVSRQDLLNYLIENNSKDEKRVILIINNDAYKKGLGNMKLCQQISECLKKKTPSEYVYQNFFKSKVATDQDLGAIIFSHCEPDRTGYSIYCSTSFKNGDNTDIHKYKFKNKSDAKDYVGKYYDVISDVFTDHLVVIIHGPRMHLKNLKNMQSMKDDTDRTNLNDLQITPLDQDYENFGMYDSSLYSWLSNHPSNASFDNYTKNKKQQIYNISSLNTVDMINHNPITEI